MRRSSGAQTGKAPAGPAAGVVVDASAYQVTPGRDGMLRALGVDPSKVRVVANATDGNGSDFEVITVERLTGRSAGGTTTPAGNVTSEPRVVVDRAYRAVDAIISRPPTTCAA